MQARAIGKTARCFPTTPATSITILPDTDHNSTAAVELGNGILNKNNAIHNEKRDTKCAVGILVWICWQVCIIDILFVFCGLTFHKEHDFFAQAIYEIIGDVDLDLDGFGPLSLIRDNGLKPSDANSMSLIISEIACAKKHVFPFEP